jgi:hypothetical protein
MEFREKVISIRKEENLSKDELRKELEELRKNARKDEDKEAVEKVADDALEVLLKKGKIEL